MSDRVGRIIVMGIFLILNFGVLFPVVVEQFNRAPVEGPGEDIIENPDFPSGTRHLSDAVGAYGIVARETANEPTIDGVKSPDEWDDAYYDIMKASGNSVYKVALKHNYTKLFVLVQVIFDDKANDSDYCEIAFDSDHNGAILEGSDWKLKLFADGTRETYSGLSGIWVPDSTGWNGKAGKNPAVYEFEIDELTTAWSDSAEDGKISGFSIHLYSSDILDSTIDGYAYWPYLIGTGAGQNPVSDPINDTTNYGDLYFNTPKLVINEVSPFGSGGSEWIELYNGGPDINLKGINLTDQDEGFYQFSNLVFPRGCYLLIVSANGVNDTDFSDGKGSLHLLSEPLWNSDTLDNNYDDILLKYGGNDAGIDYMNYSDENKYPESCPKDPASGNTYSLLEGGWLPPPTSNKVTLIRTPNGWDTDDSGDWVQTSLITAGEVNPFDSISLGYGIVAPEGNTTPTIDGINSINEWQDATYDNVVIQETYYFTIYTKIIDQYLYVAVELDENYDSILEADDFAALVFDRDHDGGYAPNSDDWLVKCYYTGTSPDNTLYNGNNSVWESRTWPSDWAADVDDNTQTSQFYEFKINTSTVFIESDGHQTGFGVLVNDTANSDRIYWPIIINPPWFPENYPGFWGHIIYKRPMLVLNNVSTFGSGKYEKIEIMNNGSTEFKFENIYITNNNGNNYFFPDIIIPPYKNLTLISSHGRDEFDYTDGSATIYLGGGEWWYDDGDDIRIRYAPNNCTLDYMRYGSGVAVDDHFFDPTSTSGWTVNAPELPAPSVVQYLYRSPDGSDTDRTDDWRLSSIKTKPLHHISLVPFYEYPSNYPIPLGGKTGGWKAVGWNDAIEKDQNLTWTPSWDTSNGLGFLSGFAGDVFSGFTVKYTAGTVTGFDNITITNTATGITNRTCILVYSNPLDHISLTPMQIFPSYNEVYAQSTITTYKAIGWNDPNEGEKNLTWSPSWGTSLSLGALTNFSGDAVNGFTVDYVALLTPGYDNITVTDTFTGKGNQSSIKVIGNPINHITITPTKTFPSYTKVKAGSKILGYKAKAWNDEGEIEQNLTWVPTIGTTNGLGTIVNIGGNALEGYRADYQAGYVPGYDNITFTDPVTGKIFKSCILVVANEIDHITISPKHDYPSYIDVKAGDFITGYIAFGWNDPDEVEKNLSWSPVWSTTDSLGTPSGYNGNAYSGFTCSYTAGLVAGYDNITITDTSSGIFNLSSIRITANVIDHIELTPIFNYPGYNSVNIGGTLVGFQAFGWNDVGQNERNTSWTPLWGTTDGLGTIINTGGNWQTGFTAEYLAGTQTGYDNITVTDPVSSSSARSSIRVNPNELHHIQLIPAHDFPAYKTIKVGGTLVLYSAVGWNDVDEIEKNLTWTPVWSSSNSLGTFENYNGDANSGYTVEYKSGSLPGLDNVTVSDLSLTIAKSSCILIEGNPLHHIRIMPKYTHPNYVSVKAGGTLSGFTARGWNDESETELNVTWQPYWDTSNNLGTISSLGGNAFSGYYGAYNAGLIPGYDNITITDVYTSINSRASIRIFGNPIHHITLTPTFGYPLYKSVSAGEMVKYTAFGWNDISETEMNLTWGVVWSLTDGIGKLSNRQGSASTGFTIDFIAGYTTGYENLTVRDSGRNVVEYSCINVHSVSLIQLVIISGNNQEATVGTRLKEPFVVEVQDQNAKALGAGVGIRWFITTPGLAGDGMLSTAIETPTDIFGRADCTLTLDSEPGVNIVIAEINGSGSSKVTFNALGALPRLSVGLASNVNSINAGNTFNYIVHYNNIGTEPAKNVWINNTLPDPAVYISDTSGMIPNVIVKTYSWFFTRVDVGDNSFVITCRVKSGTPDGTVLKNSFTVDYLDQAGGTMDRETSNTIEIEVMTQLIENVPPRIDNVPDLIIRYESEYGFDLTPYISDPDNEIDELFLIFSDSIHVWISPANNLRMLMNFTKDYLDTSQDLNITVSDGLGFDFDTITIKITNEYPPEFVNELPDVVMDEDTISYPFNITEYFYDRNGNALFSFIGDNSVQASVTSDYLVKIIPNKDWYGSERVIVRISSPSGAFSEDNIIITVNPVNDRPIILPIDDQSGSTNMAWKLDLSPYIKDIDNTYYELSVTTDSAYVIANGLNLTFRYTSPTSKDIITITVSDGEDQVYGQVNVSVVGNDKASEPEFIIPWIAFPILLLIVIAIIITLFVLKRRKTSIEDIFLMDDKGLLIAHVTSRMVPDMDTDIFSGMLNAIQNFVKDSFKDEKDFDLKRLEFGDSKIAIETSKSGLINLAMVYKGKGNDEQLSKLGKKTLESIEEEYGDVLKDWDGDMAKFRGAKDLIKGVFK